MALHPEIFDAVNARVADVDPRAFFFGEENLAREGAPPRVVWVPTTDSFGPPQPRGSGRADEHAIHTAQSAVDIHLWGKDTAGALALRDAFVRALRSALGPNYHLRGGSWRGQAVAANGRVYVLSLVLDVPITLGPVATATPAAEDQTDIAFSIPPPA